MSILDVYFGCLFFKNFVPALICSISISQGLQLVNVLIPLLYTILLIFKFLIVAKQLQHGVESL